MLSRSVGGENKPALRSILAGQDHLKTRKEKQMTERDDKQTNWAFIIYKSLTDLLIGIFHFHKHPKSLSCRQILFFLLVIELCSVVTCLKQNYTLVRKERKVTNANYFVEHLNRLEQTVRNTLNKVVVILESDVVT